MLPGISSDVSRVATVIAMDNIAVQHVFAGASGNEVDGEDMGFYLNLFIEGKQAWYVR